MPRVERGDVVLVMGGGRSYVIAERLLAGLSARSGAEPRPDHAIRDEAAGSTR